MSGGFDTAGRHVSRDEHYTLLRQPDGMFLASNAGRVEPQPSVDDSALWKFDLGSAFGSNYQNVVNLNVVKLSNYPGVEVVHGPARRPSEYLEELQSTGLVVLENVIDSDTVQQLQELGDQPASRDPPVARSAVVTKASLEPVSLWVMRQYMATENIRFAHTPSLQLLTKADGLVRESARRLNSVGSQPAGPPSLASSSLSPKPSSEFVNISHNDCHC